MPWSAFVLAFFLLFIAIHTFFGGLYLLQPESVQGTDGPLTWWDGFCFSVQSLSTIGYGVLYPNGFYANTLVTIEAFVGLLYGAVLTGCFFAKISRPVPQLLFSDQMLLYSINNVPNLVFRVANRLKGDLIDVNVKVHIRIPDPEANIFRLLPLALTRAHTPALSLNWVLFHPIDESSPLYELPFDEWSTQDIRILIHITGHDSIYQQLVHDRRIYSTNEIMHDHKFADMIQVNGNLVEVDLSKISQTQPIGDIL